MHPSGAKADFDWRVSVMDRAMAAGIDDVGIGPLFGLHDWRFEVLATMQHIAHLEDAFGVGPHTISVPRMEPAFGSDVSMAPPHAVSDTDFKKIIAILRLAVPYTGIILSTRESPEMRREAFRLGVSQISGGSRTNPGGYATPVEEHAAQFTRGDHRPLDEVVRDIAASGCVHPSAPPAIAWDAPAPTSWTLPSPASSAKCADRTPCRPSWNTCSTTAPKIPAAAGEKAVATEVATMEPKIARYSETMMRKVREGSATSTAEGDVAWRQAMATRREADLIGERDIAADALTGIHTARARENFPLAGRPCHPDLIKAYAAVKIAAAKTNHRLGFLADDVAEAIVRAAREIEDGTLLSEIVVDALQGGAGTSLNMNVNEVIANRAEELLGGRAVSTSASIPTITSTSISRPTTPSRRR